MDHADADVSLSDFNISHLLIEEILGNGFLGVCLELRNRDVRSRTQVAGRRPSYSNGLPA
jgi:hypothetical protein